MQNVKPQIATILLEAGQRYRLPEGYQADGEVRHINAGGRFEGWNRIRREVNDRYICLNDGGVIPQADQNQTGYLKNGEIGMILLHIRCRDILPQHYRNEYYGYDYGTMMEILEKDYPAYHKCADKEIQKTRMIYPFAGIFNKKEFNKIWDWMQDILDKCEKNIPRRCSSYQNKWKEHLIPYLFTIYITYWNMKCSIAMPVPLEKCGTGESRDIISFPDKDAPREDIIKFISGLISDGNVEAAVSFSLNELADRHDTGDVCDIFREYERQRHYSRLTLIDRENSLDKLLAVNAGMDTAPAITRRPKMLVFRWTSIGHETNIRAFENFGFECTCISMPGLKHSADEEFLKMASGHLESERYDVAFSTNFIGLFAEACYMHGIPYIAWCYDAGTFNGKQECLYYPTTNVFLFDSGDAADYREMGVERAYYLPLAADTGYFDGITCSDEDRARYNAEISFVGSLYDSKLPEAMGYLTDYQKAYLGALVDSQMDVYGYSFFPEAVSGKTMEWLSSPGFNRAINDEFDGLKERSGKFKEAKASPRALRSMLNKQTTNKERSLLLALLAKHHEVKLYSYRTNEVFKDLTFCGTADYYTQMPKIFKCSRINLNATFRNIPNGIPLRCIDVMGCGGCLLTNYQKDFDGHFRDGENVLFYRSAEEALDKADFYLAHDTLREKIARSGYETVKKYYDYPVKIREMLEMAGLRHLIRACGR